MKPEVVFFQNITTRLTLSGLLYKSLEPHTIYALGSVHDTPEQFERLEEPLAGDLIKLTTTTISTGRRTIHTGSVKKTELLFRKRPSTQEVENAGLAFSVDEKHF